MNTSVNNVPRYFIKLQFSYTQKAPLGAMKWTQSNYKLNCVTIFVFFHPVDQIQFYDSCYVY